MFAARQQCGKTGGVGHTLHENGKTSQEAEVALQATLNERRETSDSRKKNKIYIYIYITSKALRSTEWDTVAAKVWK